MSAHQQGNVLGHCDNEYDYTKVTECLKMQYGKEVVHEIDRRNNRFPNASLVADEDTQELPEHLSELLQMAEEDNSEEIEVGDVDPEDISEAIMMAKTAVRDFKQPAG